MKTIDYFHLASIFSLQDEVHILSCQEMESEYVWEVGTPHVVALLIISSARNPVFCRVMDHIYATKQTVSKFMHRFLPLVGGRSCSPRIELFTSASLKTSTSRQVTAGSGTNIICSNLAENNAVDTLDESAKSRMAPNCSSPSFTCVAMLLSINNNLIVLEHDAQKLLISCFVQDSNTALKMIQQQ